MRESVLAIILGLLTTATGSWGCSGKYDNAPEASRVEFEAIRERYQALIDEARKAGDGRELDLLHHFGQAVLSRTETKTFEKLAARFVANVKTGKLDEIEAYGGRAPGKVRLLLVSTDGGKGAIPFVKGADGWKLDDVEAAFGKYDKDLDIMGTVRASASSELAALASLQDPQASSLDRVQAALELAEAGNRRTTEKYASGEKSPWPRAALLYAVWKSGGTCEPFAQAFPIEGDEQQRMYDDDTKAYRALLRGLIECASSSGKLPPVLRVYLGCHAAAESGPRSEYVDPVVKMADARPELVLEASVKARIAYEKDPVANILVGALHGEGESPFYQFVNRHARGRSRTARLARLWVAKMAEREKP